MLAVQVSPLKTLIIVIMYSFKFNPICSFKYSMWGFVGRRGSVLWFGGFRPEGRGKQSFLSANI